MKLSIITINKDNAVGLRKTIESVLFQTWQEFEYIIVDGGSSDGSKELIDKAAETKKFIHWISEPDKGIYEAMNKGIRMSEGEYIHFLNSGDYLYDKNVYKTIFAENIVEDIVYGNQIDAYADKQILNKGYARSNLSFLDIYKGAVYHSSAFTKKSLFDQYGYFDETYKIISDYIFYVKSLGFGDTSVKYINTIVSVFDCTGISSQRDGAWNDIHEKEDQRAYKELFSPRLLEFCQESEVKINIYDTLKSNSFTWFIVRVLVKMIYYFKKPNFAK